MATAPPDASQSATWVAPAPAAVSGMTSFASLAPGTMVGTRYRVESLLGQGGMGAVYKVYDGELDRTVALKLVRPGLAEQLETMQRFKQELLLASRISHKNILRIHDLGDWNGAKFITMAYVEGGDLAHLIQNEGPLTFERALHFTRQLCAALEAAHHEGVIHRDLKPQNILIDRNDTLYVSDFGLAKSLESEATTMTRAGQILGTPRYMSPEQVEAGEVGQASDLYTLGVILYEMFTSQMPFRGDSAMQLMYQRVTEAPRDPRLARPDLPEYLARIILKCLEKDPARRYRDAREVLHDLDAKEAPRPHPRRRWGLAAAAVVLSAGLFFAVPATRHWALGPAIVRPHYYLAILPPKVSDDSVQYLADGAVDALSAKLAGLHDVYVAYGEAVKGAMRTRHDPQQIAAALGVNYLVGLSVLSSADKVSLTVTMDYYGDKPGHSQPEEVHGARQDLLTLEDNIFGIVVRSLTIRETNEELARTQLRPTEDRGAYEAYLKGRNLLRGTRDQAHLTEALKLFQQAVDSDSRFALAYTGLADANLAMSDETKDPKWTNDALETAQQAESLNPKLPEAHFSLGTIYTVTGKTDMAIGELQLALEQAPNSDEGFRRLGLAYSRAGKRDQAIAALTRATELNRYYWINFSQLAFVYFKFGDNQGALKACQRVTELAPDNPTGWANLGAAYYRVGQFERCIAAFQKAINLQPKAEFYSQLGTAHFFAGQRDLSVKDFSQAVEMLPKSAVFRTNLGDAYRWSAQKDKAAGAYAGAITAANDILAGNPQDTAALGCLAICYAKTGETGRALDYIQRARGIDPNDNDLMYREATVYALAQRNSEALKSLGNALRHGYSLSEAQNDPELAELRNTPGFAQMLAEVSKGPR
jgi:tetratricopeptide (TPR) repeat protein/predicted Ser/Thr protein kinase